MIEVEVGHERVAHRDLVARLRDNLLDGGKHRSPVPEHDLVALGFVDLLPIEGNPKAMASRRMIGATKRGVILPEALTRCRTHQSHRAL
jgi:hypothetical protein